METINNKYNIMLNWLFRKKAHKAKSKFQNEAEIIMREYGDGRKEYYIRTTHDGLEDQTYYSSMNDPENKRKTKYFNTIEDAEAFMNKYCILNERVISSRRIISI